MEGHPGHTFASGIAAMASAAGLTLSQFRADPLLGLLLRQLPLDVFSLPDQLNGKFVEKTPDEIARPIS